jgi:hypothetical protein
MANVDSRRHRFALAALLAALLLTGLAMSAAPASGARLSSSKAKSAVIKYVKKKWGSDYAVHPACYSLGARKSKCLVHLVHSGSSCTKYATVKLRNGRTSVTMAKPSC